MLRHLTGISEIVRQVTNYSKTFSTGYCHLILGRTTTSPASRATPGLQRGLLRETLSWNGKRLIPRVPLYGYMGNVR
jgi:hypothetical protein